MTATAPEQVYDDEIAPMLRAVVEKCQDLGLHMVAHVEWADGGSGITQWVPDGASVQLRMTQLAAHSHGNFDKLGINMLKTFDCSASMFLHKYTEQKA